MKFVLLEHDTRPDPAAPSNPAAVHYDLMIDFDGRGGLATWRLARLPHGLCDQVPAERLADHRRAYLEYEGEIRGNRGRVRRVDQGGCEWVDPQTQSAQPATAHVCGVSYERDAARRMRLLFRGELLRGVFELAEGTLICIASAP